MADIEREESLKSLIPSPKRPKGWGQRHTMAILSFFGFAFSYAMRFNLSIAIVAMVKRNRTVDPTNSTIKDACPLPSPSTSNNVTSDYIFHDEAPGEFEWDEVQQGIILGAFFWGYVVTQLPGGILSQRYGGKWTLGLGILLTGIFAILTPVAARLSTSLLIFVRIVQGLGEGLCTPAMHSLLAKWAPPSERGELASIAYSGTSFGTAASMIVSGYLIQWNVLGGWPSVFYSMGFGSILWFILWAFLVFDSPSKHPRISNEELSYIQNSIGSQLSEKPLPTPWKKIFSSLPLWVILIAHTGHTWGLYTLLTELPTYMKIILNFDMKQNSWLSSLPYGVMWISAIVIPMIADIFIAKNWLKTINVRKICQIIAHAFSGLALIGASYSGCDRVSTVFFLTLAVGANGASFAGFGVNHVDIAANHAGILMGITNTVANACGIIAPYVAGLLINGNETLGRWQIVFFIAAGIYFVDTVIYLIFASSTEQSWNRPEVDSPLRRTSSEDSQLNQNSSRTSAPRDEDNNRTT